MWAQTSVSDLAFATRTATRSDRILLWIVLPFFGSIVPCFSIVARLWPPHPMTANDRLALDVLAVVYASLFLVTIAWIARLTPRGSWLMTADGVTFHPERGRPRSIRWKDVERVRWSGPAVVTLRNRRVRVPILFSLVDEPIRSEALARLDAVLQADFDLAHHKIPDWLDGVKSPWLNHTLRATRAASLGLGLGLSLVFWLYFAGTWFLTRGAWQIMAGFCVWLILPAGLLVRFALFQRLYNPSWRVRLTKPPPIDPLDDW